MHTAEASKQKAAAEALERQLEAALARALMLQGQLDSEISGHGDTQASLQRAREQVQPSALCLVALTAQFCRRACTTDQRMAAMTGDQRGGPARSEPALLRAAAGVQRQPAAGHAKLGLAAADVCSPAAAPPGWPDFRASA